jgi:hypothetical protein
MPKQRFQLQLRMEICPLDERGYPDRSGLSIADNLEISADNFLEIAGVLARFHELAEVIREEEATDA